MIVQPGTPTVEVFFSYTNDSLNFVSGDVIPGGLFGGGLIMADTALSITTPEPSTLVLLVLGMVGLVGGRRRVVAV